MTDRALYEVKRASGLRSHSEKKTSRLENQREGGKTYVDCLPIFLPALSQKFTMDVSNVDESQGTSV